jgi:hypothetical protein
MVIWVSHRWILGNENIDLLVEGESTSFFGQKPAIPISSCDERLSSKEE